MLVITAWQWFVTSDFAPEMIKVQVQERQMNLGQNDNKQPVISKSLAESKKELTSDKIEEMIQEQINLGTRIKIENSDILGSINLVGAKIDDLTLKHYKENLDPGSADVRLLSPLGGKEMYEVSLGFLNDLNQDMPNQSSIWKADKKILNANDSVTLEWKNKAGVKFITVISLDDRYMVTVKQEVVNNSGTTSNAAPYVSVNRTRGAGSAKNMILHEGVISVVGDKLDEISFEDLQKKRDVNYGNDVKWLGFADKYWLSAVIPTFSHAKNNSYVSSYQTKSNQQHYQVDFVAEGSGVDSGKHEVLLESKIFLGPKVFKLLDDYSKKYNIYLFDRTVDFGVLYVITKPLFLILEYFYQLIGNFGLAIMLLTIVVKMALFPLAYKSFTSMNKLKQLMPEITRLKKVYGDNAQLLQKYTMELYKKEKVNPMGGCLPIIVQMPVFFALYKVLYVTIEMRHAPFFGWIHDLSAPDSTTIFNLFGLISWTPPEFLMIGVLPILMALSMFIQQRLNPQPSDEIQATAMKFMPLIFLFMFASFPSGLLLYWTWSNLISIIQQTSIKRLASKGS